MQTQSTRSNRCRVPSVAVAIVLALASASAGAQPARSALKIDGSSPARFEASVAAIQNDLRTLAREEFETALAAVWFSDTARSGDADRDGDHDADDLKIFRDDAFDLLTNIERGNVATAIEDRATDAHTAADYFRQLDGLGSDEVVGLANRPAAAAYLAPLWQFRRDDLCRHASIQATHLLKNCRRDGRTAKVFDSSTARALSAAVEALHAGKYDEARAAVGKLNVKRLSPYEASKAEQILFNVALSEKNYPGARGHLQNAMAAGGLSPQEISAATAQIRALDALLAANAP